MPGGDQSVQTWAKCDMLMNVSLNRLEPIRVGPRRYEYPEMTPDDFAGVKAGILWGLGMGNLLPAAE